MQLCVLVYKCNCTQASQEPTDPLCALNMQVDLHRREKVALGIWVYKVLGCCVLCRSHRVSRAGRDGRSHSHRQLGRTPLGGASNLLGPGFARRYPVRAWVSGFLGISLAGGVIGLTRSVSCLLEPRKLQRPAFPSLDGANGLPQILEQW